MKKKQRVEEILAWHVGDELFSDEKLLILQQSLNPQNDRVWSLSIDNICESLNYVPRYQNASFLVVWGTISKRGQLPLVFIDKGVKTSAQYHTTEVLEKRFTPKCPEYVWGGIFLPPIRWYPLLIPYVWFKSGTVKI